MGGGVKGGTQQKTQQTQTGTQTQNPYAAAIPGLQQILTGASGLYDSGQLAQQADFTPDQLEAFQGIRDLAGQPGIVGEGQATLSRLMDPSQYRQGLEGVRQDVLGGAIPAAVAQFSGSGLTDSSVAQQEVGRAASQALAPVEYGAYQQAQDRALQAAGAAPGFQAAQYLPLQMLAGIGGQQQQQAQAGLDLPYQALQRLSGLTLPIGALGGTTQTRGTTTGRQSQTQSPGALGILGSALQAAPFLASLSDRRLKRDIRPFGTGPRGHKLYEFKYLWDDTVHVGPMADEVPEAVIGHIGPYSVINYGAIL